MKCLVTGHRGYIGRKLYNRLSEMGHEVMGIDLKDGLDINTDLFHGVDGKSFHPKYFNFKPEYVFHMACLPRVLYSVQNPVETTKNNVLATTNVLNFSKAVGAKRVIFSSSSSVMGDGDGPISPYALQKFYSEMECKLWSKIYELDTVSLRYFNVYSEDQTADDSYATAISNWMSHIRRDETPFVNGDGENRRDLVHVDDVISANIFAMLYEKPFNGSIYDVGTGDNISLNEIISIVHQYFPELQFIKKPPRPGDVFSTKANTSDLAALGWKAKIKIDTGISSCFDKLKKFKNGAGRAAMRNRGWIV